MKKMFRFFLLLPIFVMVSVFTTKAAAVSPFPLEKNNVSEISSDNFNVLSQNEKEKLIDFQQVNNDTIFFLTDCGSSCETFTVVNTKSKEKFTTDIVNFSSNRGTIMWTVFFDQFDKKHTLNGVIKNITSTTKDSKTYFTFELEDPQGNVLPSEQFSFL